MTNFNLIYIKILIFLIGYSSFDAAAQSVVSSARILENLLPNAERICFELADHNSIAGAHNNAIFEVLVQDTARSDGQITLRAANENTLLAMPTVCRTYIDHDPSIRAVGPAVNPRVPSDLLPMPEVASRLVRHQTRALQVIQQRSARILQNIFRTTTEGDTPVSTTPLDGAQTSALQEAILDQFLPLLTYQSGPRRLYAAGDTTEVLSCSGYLPAAQSGIYSLLDINQRYPQDVRLLIDVLRSSLTDPMTPAYRDRVNLYRHLNRFKMIALNVFPASAAQVIDRRSLQRARQILRLRPEQPLFVARLSTPSPGQIGLAAAPVVRHYAMTHVYRLPQTQVRDRYLDNLLPWVQTLGAAQTTATVPQLVRRYLESNRHFFEASRIRIATGAAASASGSHRVHENLLRTAFLPLFPRAFESVANETTKRLQFWQRPTHAFFVGLKNRLQAVEVAQRPAVLDNALGDINQFNDRVVAQTYGEHLSRIDADVFHNLLVEDLSELLLSAFSYWRYHPRGAEGEGLQLRLEATAGWWATRRVALQYANILTQLESRHAPAISAIQQRHQACRRLYAEVDVQEFRRHVEQRREINLNNLEFQNFYAILSRSERAQFMIQVLQMINNFGLWRHIWFEVGSENYLRFLSEYLLVRLELNRSEVLTWNTLEAMSSEERVVLTTLREQLLRYFSNLSTTESSHALASLPGLIINN